jgi:hypothetical protein
MAARLGLDTSDFVEKMKGVEGFSSASGQRIAAEMKRTSREGAESLRLFDEAIGVHLSRPLTRLITETFPGVAEGLASVLGGTAFIAIGAAALEFGERIVNSIQRATKAQEEFRQASIQAADVLEKIGNDWAGKMATLDKTDPLRRFREGAHEARTEFEQISKVLDDVNRKREEAESPLSRLEAGIGNAWDNLTQGSTASISKNQQEQVERQRRDISHALLQDELHGTHTSLQLIDSDLASVNAKIEEYQRLGPGAFSSRSVFDAQIAALERQKSELQNDRGNEVDRQAWEQKARAADAATAAKELATKQQEELRKVEEAVKRTREETDRLTKSLGEAFGKDDLVARFNVELNAQLTALNQLQAMAGAKGFQERIGMSPDAARDFLIQANILRESEAQLKSFLESNEMNKRPGSATSFPFAGASTATPVLGAGSAADGQFAAFEENKRAQMEAIKKIFEDALTPQQRFIEKQRELDLVMKDANGNFIAGERGALAYKQAMKELTDQEIQALNATGKVSDAIKAWALEAQKANIGQEIVGGMKSAESATASSLTIMLEHHRNATEQLRQLWEGFFQSLTQKALSFGLDKLFGSLLHGLTSGSSGAATASAGPVPGFVGWFADGGDVTPGQSFISGEAGTEEIRLTAGGGAHVTPLGGGSGGGSAYYDMRGSVVSEDLMKRAEAHRLISLSEQRMMQSIPSMQREISLRKRPG